MKISCGLGGQSDVLSMLNTLSRNYGVRIVEVGYVHFGSRMLKSGSSNMALVSSRLCNKNGARIKTKHQRLWYLQVDAQKVKQACKSTVNALSAFCCSNEMSTSTSVLFENLQVVLSLTPLTKNQTP